MGRGAASRPLFGPARGGRRRAASDGRRARFGIIPSLADFVPVCKVDEVPPGTGKVVDADGVEIAVFNAGGVFHALENSCPSGGSIGEGRLRGEVVTCPLDGETYDVRTGISPISDAIFVRHFDVKVNSSGTLLVRLEPTEDEDDTI